MENKTSFLDIKDKFINLIEKTPLMIPIILCIGCLITFVIISLGYIDALLNNQTLNLMTNVFLNISNIILIFLVFFAAYISYLNSKSTKSFIISITFLIIGSLNVFLYIYNLYSYINSGSFQIVNAHIYVFERLMMAIVLYSVVHVEQNKMTEFSNKPLIFMLPVISLIILVLVASIVDVILEVVSYESLVGLISFLEILVALIYIISLYKMNKKYRYSKQLNMLLMNCAFIVFIMSQAVFFVDYTNETIAYMLNNLFRLFALIFLLESILFYDARSSSNRFKNQENQLKLYAERLDVVIEKRTQKMQDETNQFINELEYAKLIQQSLLPPNKMHFKNNTNFLNEYFPCERLSGDFYDIYKIDEDNIAMYILDVSGHGISAALMTMFCNNYIKSTERLIKRYRGLKPHKNLKHFYDEFNKMNFPEEMHMVVFFASYNVVTKVLTYCSGGMNCEPIVFKKNGRFELLDKSQGFPICKLSDFFQPEFSSEKIMLEEGDKVIFYTDGLIDKLKNNIIDTEELVELFVNNSSYSAKEINDILVSKINPYKDSLDDDISYFIMEI